MSDQAQSMKSLMQEKRKFLPPADLQANAYVNSMEQYEELYKRSIEDPDGFWLDMAKALKWILLLKISTGEPPLSPVTVALVVDDGNHRKPGSIRKTFD